MRHGAASPRIEGLQVDSDVLIKYRGKKCRGAAARASSFFSPSVYDRGLLSTLEGYSIRVTDPESDLAVPWRVGSWTGSE